MRTLARILSLPLLLVLVATGCAKAPTEEIAAADQAMEAADSAEAAVYAPESWAAVGDARAQLDAEIQAQEESFALTRSYGRARTLAVEVKTAAEQAAVDAAAEKERVRTEASGLIEQAKASREEVQTLLANAPQGKGTMADLAALKADAVGTEQYLEEARLALDAGNYMEAKTKAEAALRELDRVKEQIRTAQQARGGPA